MCEWWVARVSKSGDKTSLFRSEPRSARSKLAPSSNRQEIKPNQKTRARLEPYSSEKRDLTHEGFTRCATSVADRCARHAIRPGSLPRLPPLQSQQRGASA